MPSDINQYSNSRKDSEGSTINQSIQTQAENAEREIGGTECQGRGEDSEIDFNQGEQKEISVKSRTASLTICPVRGMTGDYKYSVSSVLR